MSKGKAALTSVNGRAVGSIGFGMLGKSSRLYTFLIRGSIKPQVDATCSRFHEAMGARRLSYRSQSHEDSARAGC